MSPGSRPTSGRSLNAMAGAGVERAAQRVVARCHAGLEPMALLREFVEGLGAILPVDAVFCATADPATLLFTGRLLHEIPADAAPRFLANELLEDDVNKFRTLATRRSPVEWLDRVTQHDRGSSARYREIMAPIGLGDELRAAFRSGGHAWGFLCAHREDGPSGFTAAEAEVVARVAPHLGEGLRRGVLVASASAGVGEDVPGVLVIGEDGALVASTAAGDRWLWELGEPDDAFGFLPVAVEAVLGRLAAIRAGRAPVDAQPRVRVLTRSGQWAVVHASEMTGVADGPASTAVVVEAASAPEVAPLLLHAHGLTRREGEVAQLAVQGRTTKAISRRLAISEHTVEDHLKSIYTKVGVASRGELAARIMQTGGSGP